MPSTVDRQLAANRLVCCASDVSGPRGLVYDATHWLGLPRVPPLRVACPRHVLPAPVQCPRRMFCVATHRHGNPKLCNCVPAQMIKFNQTYAERALLDSNSHYVYYALVMVAVGMTNPRVCLCRLPASIQ